MESWKTFFVPSWVNLKIIPIWFKLPKLPFEFAEPDILKLVGDPFGTFLLLHSVFEEDSLLVKICVLFNPNDTFPKTCTSNLLIVFGIKKLLKIRNVFGKYLRLLTPPCFQTLKASLLRNILRRNQLIKGIWLRHVLFGLSFPTRYVGHFIIEWS